MHPNDIHLKALLRALDGSPKLSQNFERRWPNIWRTLNTFRQRMGDTCPHVRNLLKRWVYEENQRDAEAFEQDLRAAGYAG